MIEIQEREGLWHATVRSRDRLGASVVASTTETNRESAVAWAIEHDASLNAAALDDLTVARMVMLWHDERSPSLRDTTVVREASSLAKHICRDPIATMDARELTRAQAAAFAQRLKLRDNGRGAALSTKTCRHLMKALRQCFDNSLEIDTNVFARVPLPPLSDAEMGFLNKTEIERMLSRLGEHPWGWAFGVTLLTGIRRSEFCGLKWEHVDLEGRSIDIRWRRTTAGPRVVEGALKTRRAKRRIPLDPMAARLLRERLSEQDRQRSDWGSDWSPDGERYVWTFEDGSLPNPDRLTLEFTRFCGAIGITPVGLHGLRHSFAAVAIAAGVAPYSLSRAMGHTQVAFTYDRYGHLWDDGLEEEIGKVSRLLETA